MPSAPLWTKDEEAHLKSLVREGLEPDEIAGLMGRSQTAIRVRASSMGIRFSGSCHEIGTPLGEDYRPRVIDDSALSLLRPRTVSVGSGTGTRGPTWG